MVVSENSISDGNVADSEQSKEASLAEFIEKIEAAGLSDLVTHTFSFHYQRLVAGETGYINSQEAQPVDTISSYNELDAADGKVGQASLDQVAVIKLNGGLGTSMGMLGPKSLVTVKEGLTFFDIIMRQIQALRDQHGVRVPLLLMDSFNTAEAMREAAKVYPDFQQDLPLQFIQNMIPKVDASDLRPIQWPDDPQKEWCPPGHGDLYTALYANGLLDAMIDQGYTYAFVSNADNLGAVLDEQILGYMVRNQLPFMMEVAERTAADAKGGHLAQREDESLMLREIAQCPPEELAHFQDIECYQYFNTNNLWLHLPTVRDLLQTHDGVLPLALIRNEKNVDPTLPDSPRVYQLETAMGSAIGIVPGASALCVSRSRFIPIKRTNDLLALWSDAYELTDEYEVRAAPQRISQFGLRPPLVTLDARFYTLIDDLRKRFPHGAPSLVGCNSFVVEGDIRFGSNITIAEDAKVVNQHDAAKPLPDNTIVRGDQYV